MISVETMLDAVEIVWYVARCRGGEPTTSPHPTAQQCS